MRAEPTSCTFCQVAEGADPPGLVHASEEFVAFLSNRQVRPGETVLITRRHYDTLLDLPASTYARMLELARVLGKALIATHPDSRLGMVVNGLAIQHAFIVLLPQLEKTDIISARHVGIVDGRVSFECHSLPDVMETELATRAAVVRAALNGRLPTPR